MTEVDIVREYIATQFLPDVEPAEIPPDFDLIDSGTVHSLSLLRLIAWLADRFELNLDEIPIAPDNFRTVEAIGRFVAESRAVTTA